MFSIILSILFFVLYVLLFSFFITIKFICNSFAHKCTFQCVMTYFFLNIFYKKIFLLYTPSSFYFFYCGWCFSWQKKRNIFTLLLSLKTFMIIFSNLNMLYISFQNIFIFLLFKSNRIRNYYYISCFYRTGILLFI